MKKRQNRKKDRKRDHSEGKKKKKKKHNKNIKQKIIIYNWILSYIYYLTISTMYLEHLQILP